MSAMRKTLTSAERIKEEVFSTILETMEKDGISQGEIARRIGAHRPNINKVMRGKDPVSLEFLLKIAESLGLEAELRLKRARS